MEGTNFNMETLSPSVGSTKPNGFNCAPPKHALATNEALPKLFERVYRESTSPSFSTWIVEANSREDSYTTQRVVAEDEDNAMAMAMIRLLKIEFDLELAAPEGQEPLAFLFEQIKGKNGEVDLPVKDPTGDESLATFWLIVEEGGRKNVGFNPYGPDGDKYDSVWVTAKPSNPERVKSNEDFSRFSAMSKEELIELLIANNIHCPG